MESEPNVQSNNRSDSDIPNVLSNQNSSSASSSEGDHSNSSKSTTNEESKSSPKFERTPKQLAAFEKMRTVRAEKRKLGAQQKEVPRESQKSMEEAAAMFMAMRKKEKEEKKEKAWERLLNDTMTKRMDEFEDRLVGLFNEPVERYVEKRKRKSTKDQPVITEPVREEPVVEKVEKEPPKKIEEPPTKRQYVPKQTNPFRRAH